MTENEQLNFYEITDNDIKAFEIGINALIGNGLSEEENKIIISILKTFDYKFKLTFIDLKPGENIEAFPTIEKPEIGDLVVVSNTYNFNINDFTSLGYLVQLSTIGNMGGPINIYEINNSKLKYNYCKLISKAGQ